MSRPDTFIVGAPRCGTTWLFEQLAEHPDVAVSDRKEPTHFGSDLDGIGHSARHRLVDRAEYLACFPDDSGRRTMEASARYLFSLDAIEQLSRFAPDARCIALVRDPIEQICSLHALRVALGVEMAADLRVALDHEQDVRGRTDSGPLLGHSYVLGVDFASQLERMWQWVPRERTMVIVHDDIQDDPAAVFRDVFAFLDLDDRPLPTAERVNARHGQRSAWLTRTLRFPTSSASRLIRAAIPHRRTRTALRSWLTERNRIPGTPVALDPDLRSSLAAQLRPGVDRLGELLDRDLSHWMVEGDRG